MPDDSERALPGVALRLRIIAIRNPVSGRGTGDRQRSTVEALLQKHLPNGATLDIWSTERPGHAPELAAKAALDADLVIAIGGDGTLSDVANGLIEAKVPMGIIPLGTGNDLARHLGLHGDLDYAARIAFTGTPTPTDVGRWTLGGQSRYFLNIAGCGFDAEVAERVNRGYRSLKGTLAYIAAVLEVLGRYQATPLRLTIDGEVHEVEAMLCAIANSSSYGGGMKVAPVASVTDGLLDVVLVEKISKFGFLQAFPSVFKGAHLSHPKVKAWTAKTVRLESMGGPSPLVLSDGELIGNAPADFEIVPGALALMR